jgi:hypothetical protein
MISDLYDIPSVAQYLRRIKAETRGLYTAVIREKRGKYFKDLNRIEFDPADGKVSTDDSIAPSELEQQNITAEWTTVTFPEYVTPARAINLPQALMEADANAVFEFKDRWGKILMLQQRLDPKDDMEEKRYIPWTYWSDDQWRKIEPPTLLPLYGLDKIGDYTTVFIHEGAKAARAMHRLLEDNKAYHPWLEELRAGAHVGWSGGALNPRRTDWFPLEDMGIKRAFIVSDNDKPGREAVAPISQKLRMQTFHVQFTDEWPSAFDLADEFPKKMFAKLEGKEIYRGPMFESCVHPATWMTDEVKQPKGRPAYFLRPHVTEEWFYVDRADMFVNLERPHIAGNEKIINTMLASFSDTSDTCRLISKKYSGRMSRLCYRPDVVGRKVTEGNTSAINMHIPPAIRSMPGNPEPFLEFMRYLVVKPEECKEALRWCATLIAKPEVRMLYGLLLISEMQGVGKSTLSSRILAPLVGMSNVGFPTENDIVESQFNSWMANKRLVVVSEIYSGHSWKAYNKLKTYITDTEIMVNEKQQKRYQTENWAHFIASSNSVKAMKIEDEDRRWLCPECTEIKWPAKKFKEFNEWINAGGLAIIKHWAENFGDYVAVGEAAPMTTKKKEMIAASRTPEEVRAAELAERIIFEEVHVALSTRDIEVWSRYDSKGKSFSTAHDLRKAMLNEGMVAHSKRIRIGGVLQYVLLSPALFAAHQAVFEEPELEEKTIAELIRKHIKYPQDIAPMSSAA